MGAKIHHMSGTPRHLGLGPRAILLALLAPLLLSVAACGSDSATRRYVDRKLHFSFRYPSSWTPPPHGGTFTTTPANTYILHFVKPPGFRVVVHAPIPLLNKVPNGKVISRTATCPFVCTFFRIHVSGLPAVFVRQTNGSRIVEEDADINSRLYGWELNFPNYPNMSKAEIAQFAKLLKTFRIPKFA